MQLRSLGKRRFKNTILILLSTFAALIGAGFLIWILGIVVGRGFSIISYDFFTQLPTPPGMFGGGLGNAILGSLLLTLLGTMLGVPVGLFAGVYLSEYGRGGKLASLVRFSANSLMSLPSIIVGVFVYSLIVKKIGHFSGLAGAVALAIIMIPIVCRTAEDMLSLLPNALRESALALGIPRWRVINSILFKAARPGLMTGVLLSIARISGETAPLLFTALNNPFWPNDINQPTANLPVTIFNYAMSPYENWQQLAWGASFLILAAVLGLNVISRTLLREKK